VAAVLLYVGFTSTSPISVEDTETRVSDTTPPKNDLHPTMKPTKIVEDTILEKESQTSAVEDTPSKVFGFTGTVTNIVDGDTLGIDSTRVRLALVDTIDWGESGYENIREYTASQCPVGSTATFVQDRGQLEGSYGRAIGLVYCGSDTSLNELLLESGNGKIWTSYCAKSEFGNESWAQKFGC